jgi:ubiquitin-like protein Pup
LRRLWSERTHKARRDHERHPLIASKDTGGQKRASKTSEEVDEAQVDESTGVAERKEKLDDDIDAMLDEIDDVLETNSEDFVRSFVQKGGE